VKKLTIVLTITNLLSLAGLLYYRTVGNTWEDIYTGSKMIPNDHYLAEAPIIGTDGLVRYVAFPSVSSSFEGCKNLEQKLNKEFQTTYQLSSPNNLLVWECVKKD
jgi:hypothetical protein